MARAGTPRFYAPEELFNWPDSLHLDKEAHPCAHTLNDASSEFPFPLPTEYHTHGPRPWQYTQFRPKSLIGAPFRTSKSSHTIITQEIQALPDRGEPLNSIRHSSQMVGFLSKYCMARDQTLLNGAFNANHPAFQPDAHPPSSWEDFNSHLGRIPDAHEQARVLHKLRDLYLVQAGRSATMVNGEPAVVSQVFAQICEPINVMLKTRYREGANSWRPGTGHHWMLPNGAHTTPNMSPQWGNAVFNNKKFGTQTAELDDVLRAGDPDGILFATLRDYPALLEIKTWWSVSRSDLDEIFETISSVGGKFIWGDLMADSAALSLIKQMWGEFNAYQTRLGIFVNGRHIAFVIRTCRNELTFSEFLDWEDREVYTAFLGFSMLAIDAVLSGPADGYHERLRDSINLICPHGNRKIKANGEDHPQDGNTAQAGAEMWTAT
ncbi:hypothetical protein BV25DRAFT_967408 [Artomyces pyxidatus]|uniref:Uncharacterized protein n=1 Tax=Artomyces pyxidatus TaxID=48021 RepID=A0ACB8SUR3_9AGAM|nr:hypothetical protein BV25DRAFT_967408 [Artomyces pyxidatus]